MIIKFEIYELVYSRRNKGQMSMEIDHEINSDRRGKYKNIHVHCDFVLKSKIAVNKILDSFLTEQEFKLFL